MWNIKLRTVLLYVVALIVACFFVSQAQAANLDIQDIALKAANWTKCDITTTPILSCGDCKTRLICKGLGGLLISCLNPYRPYCVNGICSPIPSEACAQQETSTITTPEEPQ